jgi:hypothetical protein
MSGFGAGDGNQGQATVSFGGSTLNSPLYDLLMAPDLKPGDSPSYQLCKEIYLYHPLGVKMAEAPIAMAQSQGREITIQGAPEERVKTQFLQEWNRLRADTHIANVASLSRVYGIASIVMVATGFSSKTALTAEQVQKADIGFNVLDPLNTAGSLVLTQNPNDGDFQKPVLVAAAGEPYHPSRGCTLLNGSPVYLAYSNSAFGYVGRSVYQPVLFPLKSFIQSMLTDDMVMRKAGVIVVKMKSPGSIIDGVMQRIAGLKRQFIREARTENVISVGHEDEVSAIDLTNIAEAISAARKNVLENIAAGARMPAQLINSETFAEGFGEGSEDAKTVARYIDRVRMEMRVVYDYFDDICMTRAWTPEFYKTIQAEFPEYEGVSYTKAYYDWRNNFNATWPSLLTEPDSEKVKVSDVKLKAIIALLEVLLPQSDPDNKAAILAWASDNINDLKLMFPTPLTLDVEAMANFTPPPPPMMGGAPGGEEGGGGAPAEPTPPTPMSGAA